MFDLKTTMASVSIKLKRSANDLKPVAGGNLTSDVRKGQSSQATFEGDAKIQSNADVLLYSGFATIKGRLSIEGLQVNAPPS